MLTSGRTSWWCWAIGVILASLTNCTTPPQCLDDSDCNAGVCVRGACEALDRTCDQWRTCSAPDVCNQGLCFRPGRCRENSQCRAAEACVGGVCLPTRCADGMCPRGSYCSWATGACEPQPCASDPDCPDDLGCDTVVGCCISPELVPTVEACDGRDNDLDGMVDEGFHLNEECRVGAGECVRDGVYACMTDGHDSQCNVEPGRPVRELCDDRDNDCDGAIDEDFDELGGVCVAGFGVCAEGRWICRADHAGLDCAQLLGHDAAPERCDGIDNDCDGEVDEDFASLGLSCVRGLGACRVVGVEACTADGGTAECAVTDLATDPQPEQCDGIDNNCDGEVDEDVPGCRQ